LHPDIKPTDDALLLPDGTRCHWHVTGGRAVIRPAIWHPEFGLSVPNTCIEVTLFDEKTVFELAW
jgi:hypothetical protein